MEKSAAEPSAKLGVLRREAAFAFIFATVLLDMLAIGIVIPVLPKLVVDFVGGDTEQAAKIFGIFGTAWALMQFLFSPFQGALSDTFGRRPLIVISNFGVGLDYVLMALAPTLGWLFVGRVISGITAASIATAYAYVADVTPPDKRAARFGLLGAAFGAGFVLGPALGGLAGSISPRLPFWIAAGLSLANAFYGFVVLPESLSPARRAAFRWQRANPFGALVLLRSHAELFGLAFVNFFGNLAHAVLPSIGVLYMLYRYGWDESTVGLTLAAVGMASIIVQGGVVGPVTKWIGERAALAGRTCVRRRGLSVFRARPEWRGILDRHSADGAVGLGRPGLSGVDEPLRRCRRTGPIAGRQFKYQRHCQSVRTGTFYSGLRGCDRHGGELASSRRAISHRRAAARGRGRRRLERHAAIITRVA